MADRRDPIEKQRRPRVRLSLIVDRDGLLVWRKEPKSLKQAFQEEFFENVKNPISPNRRSVGIFGSEIKDAKGPEDNFWKVGQAGRSNFRALVLGCIDADLYR